ncbi:MFS transporter [Arthrobacter sulfonylureivorans]|uniref:MFS transporter n=1 Tax=Arthrobacter sulfonylureivorans TaxID=2486855 RepID=A0ABY3W6Y0_9MICC|nr:MFS transporter [Arthrobacter sulfonylureivorans]UNK46059.1 MFS transporter [Arthrobacter sulfonylureivorans]
MSTQPPSQPGSRLWLWVLMAAAVLTQTSLNLARPVVSYKLLALGGDAAVIGVVTAVYAVLPVVAALWLGRVSDRIASLKGMVALGAVMLAVAAVGLALAQDFLLIGISMALLGMGHLVFTIAGQSAIGRYAPLNQMDSGFGWFTAAFSLGQLLGPLLAGVLLGTGTEGVGPDWLGAINLALLLAAGIALAGAPVMLIGAHPGAARRRFRRKNDDGAGAAAVRPPMVKEPVLQILRRPGVAWNMLASLALLSVIDILVAFLPLVGEELGVAPFWVGVLLAVRACASIISRILLPWLVHRWSRIQLLVASLLGSGAAIAVTPFVLEPFWLAAVALFVGGFLLGLGQPLTMTLISHAVRPESRGAALALRLLGNRVGQVVLPLASGLVAAPLGPGGAIWFSCAVLGAAAAARLTVRSEPGNGGRPSER